MSDIATMLSNFPPGASWEGDESMCRMAPPGSPGNCRGRLCRAGEFSVALQDVIRFIIAATGDCASTSILVRSRSPYEALMQVRGVRQYVEEQKQASQFLKKALRKKVRTRRGAPIEPDLTPEAIIQAQLRAAAASAQMAEQLPAGDQSFWRSVNER